MSYYCGIDLHSTKNVVVVIDETDKIVFKKRLANRPELVLAALAPFREGLAGIVVESTYNG